MLRPSAALLLSCALAAQAGSGRVWRRADGAAALWDVPAVVQRAPGWCGPATLARALAFEGVEIPQDELARLAHCTAERGAEISALYRAAAPLFATNGLRLRAWRSPDPDSALALARAHDALAESHGLAAHLAPPETATGPIDLEALFHGADPALLREAAAPALPAFRRALGGAIDEGHPILWGVVLGIVPEPGPNAPSAPGGHLRLLVGYDDAAGLVYYSDPWGPDCPVKTMPVEDACAITMSLHSLQPVDTALSGLIDSILRPAPAPRDDGNSLSSLIDAILR